MLKPVSAGSGAAAARRGGSPAGSWVGAKRGGRCAFTCPGGRRLLQRLLAPSRLSWGRLCLPPSWHPPQGLRVPRPTSVRRRAGGGSPAGGQAGRQPPGLCREGDQAWAGTGRTGSSRRRRARGQRRSRALCPAQACQPSLRRHHARRLGPSERLLLLLLLPPPPSRGARLPPPWLCLNRAPKWLRGASAARCALLFAGQWRGLHSCPPPPLRRGPDPDKPCPRSCSLQTAAAADRSPPRRTLPVLRSLTTFACNLEAMPGIQGDLPYLMKCLERPLCRAGVQHASPPPEPAKPVSSEGKGRWRRTRLQPPRK
ncbi:uncharacterized protein LOC128334487 isoform X1 [Hemicordylus capensis]|uniref:uncharacterized protein LOC128334487 isoform X1 n=1 Tax=Hemicordylus capensis TaxID=884348 RepID=UPI002302434A|nr:uncharacterized protein LOC128334487 isoform X1 [Hemicordylus capensis]